MKQFYWMLVYIPQPQLKFGEDRINYKRSVSQPNVGILRI